MRGFQPGLYYELAAVRYVRKQGYHIQALRVRAGQGEIDIVARDKDALVFIEVKAGTQAFGEAAQRVDLAKRARLMSAADAYVKSHPHPSVRFDVVEISKDGVRLIKNAF